MLAFGLDCAPGNRRWPDHDDIPSVGRPCGAVALGSGGPPTGHLTIAECLEMPAEVLSGDQLPVGLGGLKQIPHSPENAK
jgi:hypothetical protein